jgi:hypothetical protein
MMQHTQATIPILLDRTDAADALSVTVRKLDALVERRDIVPTVIDGRILISRAELERFISSQTANHIPRSMQLKMVRESAGLAPEELESLCHLEPGTVLAVEQGRPISQQVFALLVGAAIYTGLANQEAISA